MRRPLLRLLLLGRPLPRFWTFSFFLSFSSSEDVVGGGVGHVSGTFNRLRLAVSLEGEVKIGECPSESVENSAYAASVALLIRLWPSVSFSSGGEIILFLVGISFINVELKMFEFICAVSFSDSL